MLRGLSILLLLGICYLCASQDKAIADSLYKIYLSYQKDNIDSGLLATIYDLAYYHPNPDTSEQFSKQLINKAEKINSNYWLYLGYLENGNANRVQGKLDKAIQSFFRSANYAKKLQNKRSIAVVYSALGNTYSSSKDFRNSSVYHKKAIYLLRELGDSLTLASVLLNSGSDNYDNNRNNQALTLLSEALAIYERFDNQIGMAYCLGNLGKVYNKLNRFQLAEYNILKALNILEKTGDYYSIAINKISLGDLYIKKNNLVKAKKYVEDAHNIASENHLAPQIKDAAFLLSKIHGKLENYKKAYFYQTQFITYRDSIINEKTIREMADLRTEFEVAQKQAEVNKAEAKLITLNRDKQIQRLVTTSLILFVFLIGILLFVISKNNRRTKAVNYILRTQREELIAQRDLLAEVVKTKDRLFSIISHDLRNPINALKGTTQLIREFLDSKDYTHLDELTQNMEYSVTRVQNLLDNLMEWALSQRGQYKFKPERVELNQVLLESISTFSDIAFSKEIVLSFEQKYAYVHVLADKNSLKTIFRNLISNALKFTKRNGSVDLIIEKTEGEILILVKDNGIGIHKEKLKNMFAVAAENTTWGTERERGLGIGLSLVKEFVSMNNGKISVDSILDKGTTFIVSFPTNHDQKSAPQEAVITSA